MDAESFTQASWSGCKTKENVMEVSRNIVNHNKLRAQLQGQIWQSRNDQNSKHFASRCISQHQKTRNQATNKLLMKTLSSVKGNRLTFSLQF
jgi:hypothetical protein